MKFFFNHIIVVIGFGGSIASIYGLLKMPDEGVDTASIWAIVFLGTFSLLFLIYNVSLTYRYRRRVRYADMFKEINSGFAALHSIERHASETKPEELVTLLTDGCTDLCDAVANAFSRVSGKPCSACIKLIASDTQNAKVSTLCRNKESGEDRFVGKNDPLVHKIADNTDFKKIQREIVSKRPGKAYFFSNILPWEYDYQNSRITESDWPPVKIWFLSRLVRLFSWPIPYKSAIVVPLIPLSKNEHGVSRLSGFLCVDSSRLFAFYKPVDVDILRGIADGLYNKIDQLLDQLLLATTQNEAT